MTKSNGRNRRSTHINRKTTQSIYRACDFAEAQGSSLNVYMVINLFETDAASATTLFERIRRSLRSSLNYYRKQTGDHRAVPTYLYTFENPNETSPHVNWLLHLPEEIRPQFIRKVIKAIEKAQGRLGRFDVKVEYITPGTVKTLAKYVVKGTDPDYIDHFHLQKVYAPQGTFYGKRAGISPNLGTTARQAARFNAKQWRRSKAAAAR
jgi:hypothetical protein